MSDSAAKLFERFGKNIMAGEAIFREGDFGDAMYILQEGEIEIRKQAGNVLKVLSTLKPGDFFGEMALIDKSPRSATAIASSNVKLLEVTHRSFEYMLEHNLEFTKKLVKELVEKIRSSNQLIYELLTQNKKHRVANALVRYSRTHPHPTEQGKAIPFEPFLAWATGSTGIEETSIRDILNHLIKLGRLLFISQDGVKLLVIPKSGSSAE